MVMDKFCEEFSNYQLSELTVDTILDFLDQFTNGWKPQTKRVRYAHLAAFFNFIKNNLISDFVSPCDSKMLRKRYRPKVTIQWDILEKEIVDEIIFRTTNTRNRLMLELMARGGMRIGEVLKLRTWEMALIVEGEPAIQCCLLCSIYRYQQSIGLIYCSSLYYVYRTWRTIKTPHNTTQKQRSCQYICDNQGHDRVACGLASIFATTKVMIQRYIINRHI